ncbi:MAG: hypothetical protein IT359_19865 [Gemmatimonadaceae bacterium]|nr:hypothetical protein [Gemmatimonadaceae bacterium]
MGHRRQLTARALREALGTLAHAVDPGGAALEVSLSAQDAPRTRAAPLLCDAAMRAHALLAPSPNDPQPGAFAAFLDGVQESRVLAYVGTVPIVHGRSGAVVRARVDRRLVTWGDLPLTDEAIFAPVAALPSAVTAALEATERPLVDTTEDNLPLEELHPQQMLRRAVQLVQRGREALEQRLADEWCAATPHAPLYVDGGLSPSATVLGGARAVGVIKSHHTLYATGAALATVMALRANERSSLFVVESRWREPVASWYLRLRPSGGHDPLWGLARIELSLAALAAIAPDADAACDEVSQWVAAEASPLALPDARWDTMAYGIRDCEVYLRATLGRLGSS